MQCQKCGKEITEGKQFCAECESINLGAQSSQLSQPSQYIPPANGGQPASDQTVQPQPIQPQPVQPQPVQPQPITTNPVNPNQPNAYIAPNIGPSAPGSKNMVKVVVSIVVALITFFGVRWFQEEQKWGKFKENYSSTCENGATKVGVTQRKAETYCSCTLDEMQDKYSKNEIYKIDEEMQSNGSIVPDELMPIVTDCANKIK